MYNKTTLTYLRREKVQEFTYTQVLWAISLSWKCSKSLQMRRNAKLTDKFSSKLPCCLNLCVFYWMKQGMKQGSWGSSSWRCSRKYDNFSEWLLKLSLQDLLTSFCQIFTICATLFQSHWLKSWLILTWNSVWMHPLPVHSARLKIARKTAFGQLTKPRMLKNTSSPAHQ